MVMSTKTAAALIGRRRTEGGPMVKLYILQAFEMGGGAGIAEPGQVIEFTEDRARHLLSKNRARLATAADTRKRRKSKADDETDAETA